MFIVCVDMSEKKIKQWGKPEIWILPSTEFKKYATTTQVGDEKRYLLSLPARPKHENRKREEILEKYCAAKNDEAWKLLTESSE